jgi:ubiquitin-conjugating enzyme E2 J2
MPPRKRQSASASSNGKICYSRLQKELKHVMSNPLDDMVVAVNPNDLLEWEYVLIGAKDTVYRHGFYHGRVRFSKEYPWKPPAIFMSTPSGRFMTNTRLCLSISDYHPESWNPLWSASTILLGIQSFFYEDTGTVGALDGVSDEEKRRLAEQSMEYNLGKDGPVHFKKLFAELIETYRVEQERREERGGEEEEAAGETEVVPPVGEGGGEGGREGGPAARRLEVYSVGFVCAAVIVALIAYYVAAR